MNWCWAYSEELLASSRIKNLKTYITSLWHKSGFHDSIAWLAKELFTCVGPPLMNLQPHIWPQVLFLFKTHSVFLCFAFTLLFISYPLLRNGERLRDCIFCTFSFVSYFPHSMNIIRKPPPKKKNLKLF